MGHMMVVRIMRGTTQHQFIIMKCDSQLSALSVSQSQNNDFYHFYAKHHSHISLRIIFFIIIIVGGAK